MEPMMKTNFLSALIASILLSVVTVNAETPNEGSSAIHQLLKEKQYDVLFPTRYTEWHKTQAEGMAKQEAVAKLSKMFEKRHDVFLSIYKQLMEAEFTITEQDTPQPGETGKVATAQIQIGSNEIPFKLYEMKNGTWGFHL